MKCILLSAVVFCSCRLQAQRFFYVEPGDKAANALVESLHQAAQYVAPSVLASDYIIKSRCDVNVSSHTTTVTMSLEDSASLVTLFQTREEYAFAAINPRASRWFDLAVRTLIQKNMRQIIQCTQIEPTESDTRWLKPRKDKT